ncbi:MerR family transcriptional regulator [Sphaerisporangium sp. TRM90804]|uniref:MerR family transcriptional regulator n=1 Tax=Sphaerisporangium sp. TRM90804 TaxID=3031113 RepID=UPI00244A8AC3|nr:MerR family transcriptional regulator [Sphaerisporangium sp. TRM90804]MDH2425576.1 MerR family transcriptional regulator [Sphaerisporangium sp. TRM90804]
MRIGEAARTSGVSARALRFYEDEGLIVPGRCGNGYRDYCGFTVDRVIVIRSLLDSGLSVRLIRDVLPHVTGEATGRDQLCEEFLAEVRRYRDRLDARIAALTARRSALDVFLDESSHQS